MQNNLVIVESPAKAKTIEKFLGTGYKVLSSYGHIRDLKKRAFSIDIADNFKPIYEIPEDKKKVVEELKAEAKKADMVWLASDEDREGEAISWHLFEVLKLKPEKTKRIVFHEITKTAILKAIEHPRDINVDLVNAQQARRVLDRIVGFELSPVLWKKIKPALSAGRVQSVAVRLIVDREREIQGFVSEASFRVTAVFDDGNGNEVRAELNRRFKTKEEAKDFLEKCIGAEFKIEDITTRPVKKSPAAPFTTSTLQQEAARKLGYTVAQTMMLAQRLYENGLITYMRTDSVNLSELALGTSRETIVSLMGERYAKTRQYATKTKGAQEAHEAIRPTYMANQSVEGTSQEQRLYELIWKRTLASQMADAELEKTTATISISGMEDVFVAVGEVVTFDGFLRVYKESYDDDAEQESENRLLPQLVVGQQFTNREIQAVERYTQAPPRYTEASLVRKLEELGIGRPSTYAPTISTVQQRGYVEKGNREGVQRTYEVLKLTAGKIKESTRTEMTGSEKSKLLPTDVGTVVNDFLMEYFPAIMDYNFTANVEKEFDEVAEGEKPWTGLMEQFYQKFHPLVEQTLSVKSEHKVGERVLGIDPSSGKPVSVKIGRFGPMAQIGSAEDEEKPRFAQLNKEHSLETITLEEALELFKFPRALGDIDGKPVTVGKGKFGPYIRYENTYVSIPKTVDPLSVTLEEAEQMLKDKQEAEAKKVIKTFAENPDLQILNGRYGPYIAYQKKNYKIPENVEPADLNLDACFKVIELQKEKSETRKVIRSAKKKK
ncbi:type I DNA topoisomerase [Phocaeicola barnesiae]|uniref:type I DNA topoisomerase n=1 Tax=Phocaeicola barnesiae TaxID=376804 RepID=UPI000334D7CD|nr:type I DNA topoisomerase [Phocaeicola barnesiae]MBS6469145.1 type I DNA topoisomerase [Bacteroides sp.]CDD33280.1 dNA topoisomerase [Bacteroides sp. CAG:714]MCF2576890.1 type I DNA topoisomerase [Phocaeicola barnesiae]MCF2597237.1 type I DNA topoisomerase [Phocaeicola barnesiae]MDM8232185.1 type I DNA topoisomerase [Phocaeicola barnesiae]